MKIGQFANKNNLSKDTVRYYMDLGLIIPEKNGGQYQFDDKCQNSLQEILELKEMGFKLEEIKTIFMFRLLGNLTHYQMDEYYRTIFLNKHERILEDISNLMEIEKRLKKKIDDISSYECHKKFTMGIDIGSINLFKCLKCNGEMVIQNGTIEENQIIDGKLKCSCGEEYIIENGILIVPRFRKESDFRFEYNYIAEYINLTDFKYLNNIYKGLDWFNKKLEISDLKNKTILELGSGIGLALRSNYEKLPDDAVYFAVDHDMMRHRFLKSMIERGERKKNVIFICTDFVNIPIKDKSVDVLLDYSGTSNYSFDNQEFLLKFVDKYVKENACLIGGFILFKNFGFNSLIQEQYRRNFKLENIKKEINNLRFKVIDERISDSVEKGGKYEDYFVDGEKVYNYGFYGQR